MTTKLLAPARRTLTPLVLCGYRAALLTLAALTCQSLSGAGVAADADTIVTRQISASLDDVNEVNNALEAAATALWAGNGGTTAASYAGLRFTTVAIPPGATISSAVIQVYSSQSQWITYAFSIAAESSGNSAPFASSARPSQRPLTANSVNHSDNVSWAANTWYSLDEMKSVIQEVINRADWQSGNSLSVIIKGAGSGAYARKFFRSFDAGATTAPRLIVSYSNAGTPGPTATLSASPATVSVGQSSTLTWATSNATAISIDRGVGPVAPSGSLTVGPTATTAYTLTATNGTATATATTTVSVSALPSPTAALSVSPGSIYVGQAATLSWNTSNAEVVTIDQGIGPVAASGSLSVSPAAGTTYTLSAANQAGAITQSASLTVNPPPPLPTVTLNVSPSTIVGGDSATVSWSTTNASAITINQGIGAVGPSGSTAVTPATTTTYTLSATNFSGMSAVSTTLTVTRPSGPSTIGLQVSASGDDANETAGTLDLTGSSPFLGSNNSTASYTGLRFRNVAIPAGATITAAALQVYSAQSQWISYSFLMAAEASGNSPAFSTSSKISQRTLTAAQVTHSDNVNWSANTWYTLDDIKALVQEVVSRSDWASGNAISIIAKATAANFARKFIKSYDASAATAAKLSITYTLGTPPPPPPAPTATLALSPGNIVAGSAALLSWSSTDATSVSITPGIGAVVSSGSLLVSASITTTYTLTASNVTGTAIRSATVTVTPYVPPAGVNFYNIGTAAAANGGSDAVSWSPANPLIVDKFGKYIATIEDATAGSYYFQISNNKGAGWTQINPNLYLFRETLVYDAASDVLHSVTTNSGITYRRFTINRDTNNDIVGIKLDAGVGSLVIDPPGGCSGVDFRNPLALWKPDGLRGILVVMWATQKTCGGSAVTETRASMRSLSNDPADGVAANWRALNGVSDATGAVGPATVAYNVLYKYTGAYRPFQQSALITANGDRPEDIYYFNIDQNDTHGFRRLGWSAVSGNWSAPWSNRVTFGGNVGDNRGYSLKKELLSKAVYDPAHDRVYVGIARWLDDTSGDTQTLYYVDGSDAVLMAGNVYSASGAHCIYPTFDLMYDSVVAKVYFFYDVSGNSSVCGNAYYRTYDGTVLSAPAPFFTVSGQSVDIPITYQSADDGRALLFFRKNKTSDPSNPPHEVYFGYLTLP